MLSNISSTSSEFLPYLCSTSSVSVSIITATSTVKIILLLPLCFLVLYRGQQRWQQHHSFKTASHSDLFTYHLAAMQLLWVFGYFFFIGGFFKESSWMTTVAAYICDIPFFGDIAFHVLTCVERYLAVVHPITYRGLKSPRGIRVRNITITGTWLLSISLPFTYRHSAQEREIIPEFCFFILSLLVVSFCSISVLCVLIRPQVSGAIMARDGADQSKQRAFYIISVISAVVWLWFFGLLCCIALDQSTIVSLSVRCLVRATVGSFNLPSCLVLPVLYLLKNRKLACCRAQ